MNIITKLSTQIQLIKENYLNMKNENDYLKDEIESLKNQLDKLKYNNENMLLTIDKALIVDDK